MKIKKGVKLIEEKVGEGEPVQRHKYYKLSIRVTLNKGDVVLTPGQYLSHTIDENIKIHDDGFFEHMARIDRENLISGIFYTVIGMKVGGFRKVDISPHLAYRENGIPGVIPENAKITAEINVLNRVENG